MKDYMMIIGSRIVDNDWVEITCIPLTVVKKKTPLFDFNNLEQILSEVQGTKQHETHLFLKLGEWRDMELKIGSHITVEVKGDE